eukprot:TRINITY_DN2533_c0_g1_i1.p1 TRINITY_DN2533_c0_g1~~TRINITY_DN2533_c0_g1_i1.p1  ORF type:complete len:913 (-),score=329.73 TRINITY_DN2533_c0_g1_i1:127-2865(-)
MDPVAAMRQGNPTAQELEMMAVMEKLQAMRDPSAWVEKLCGDVASVCSALSSLSEEEVRGYMCVLSGDECSLPPQPFQKPFDLMVRMAAFSNTLNMAEFSNKCTPVEIASMAVRMVRSGQDFLKKHKAVWKEFGSLPAAAEKERGLKLYTPFYIAVRFVLQAPNIFLSLGMSTGSRAVRWAANRSVVDTLTQRAVDVLVYSASGFQRCPQIVAELKAISDGRRIGNNTRFSSHVVLVMLSVATNWMSDEHATNVMVRRLQERGDAHRLMSVYVDAAEEVLIQDQWKPSSFDPSYVQLFNIIDELCESKDAAIAVAQRASAVDGRPHIFAHILAALVPALHSVSPPTPGLQNETTEQMGFVIAGIMGKICLVMDESKPPLTKGDVAVREFFVELIENTPFVENCSAMLSKGLLSGHRELVPAVLVGIVEPVTAIYTMQAIRVTGASASATADEAALYKEASDLQTRLEASGRVLVKKGLFDALVEMLVSFAQRAKNARKEDREGKLFNGMLTCSFAAHRLVSCLLEELLSAQKKSKKSKNKRKKEKLRAQAQGGGNGSDGSASTAATAATAAVTATVGTDDAHASGASGLSTKTVENLKTVRKWFAEHEVDVSRYPKGVFDRGLSVRQSVHCVVSNALQLLCDRREVEMVQPCFQCGAIESDAKDKKMKVCSGCRSASYCSVACQKQHWQRHKPICLERRAMHHNRPEGMDKASKRMEVMKYQMQAAVRNTWHFVAAQVVVDGLDPEKLVMLFDVTSGVGDEEHPCKFGVWDEREFSETNCPASFKRMAGIGPMNCSSTLRDIAQKLRDKYDPTVGTSEPAARKSTGVFAQAMSHTAITVVVNGPEMVLHRSSNPVYDALVVHKYHERIHPEDMEAFGSTRAELLDFVAQEIKNGPNFDILRRGLAHLAKKHG